MRGKSEEQKEIGKAERFGFVEVEPSAVAIDYVSLDEPQM